MKSFIIKEFYHIFRDVRSMVILFGMPLIQVMIFGFAITNDLKDARLAVLDNSRDAETGKIIDKITSSGYFILQDELQSPNQIEEGFRSGKIKEVIVFENKFASKLGSGQKPSVQILADASDPNMANLLVNYTNGILMNYQLEYTQGLMEAPIEVETESRMFFNEELESVYLFIPGTIAVILMLLSAMMTSISIAREKELGTMEILLVSPLKPAQIIIGKVFPYILLSFINAITILVLGYFVFGMPIVGSLALLLAESILFIIMALALGIFFSTISNSQQTAMMLSMFVMMLPTILLSGFIFPIENMPEVLQWFCNLMPTKWFIIILRGIMLKGNGIAELWSETLILGLMTLFFIALSIKKFKIRLQ